MTQEDKELLLKDLCARLPYHVKVKVWLKDGTTEEGFLDLEHNYADVLLDAFYYNKIKEIKPYLRSMSSMTEEEKKIQKDYIYYFSKNSLPNYEGDFVFEDEAPEYIDWLNEHHFDYRGLIEKGLALEAKEGMYKEWISIRGNLKEDKQGNIVGGLKL